MCWKANEEINAIATYVENKSWHLNAAAKSSKTKKPNLAK